jgi:broad-specificity NMP kinase
MAGEKEARLVTRILLTGLSGVGKSTVVDELAARGHWAVDLDGDDYSMWEAVGDEANTPGTPVEATRDWVWRVDRVRELLSSVGRECLFVSGCAGNMGQFMPQFDHVILLSAPAAVMATRLAQRTNNAYGKDPAEVARVLDLVTTVEPLLRRAAGHEINTDRPLDQVVATVLAIAASHG